jgi:hypothetical protein
MIEECYLLKKLCEAWVVRWFVNCFQVVLFFKYSNHNSYYFPFMYCNKPVYILKLGDFAK